MPNLAKVIKGLECCTSFDSVDQTCMTCPYENDCVQKQRNTQLLQDTLSLLKAQKPMPLYWVDGIAYCGSCGYRHKKGVKYCPVCGTEQKGDKKEIKLTKENSIQFEGEPPWEPYGEFSDNRFD